MSRSMTQIETALVAAYYAATVVVAGMSALGDPAPALVGALGAGWPLYSLALLYATGGTLGLVGRLSHRREAEVTALRLLAVATAVHGGALTIDGATTSGVRLGAGTLMLTAYSINLARTVHAHEQVTQALRREVDR